MLDTARLCASFVSAKTKKGLSPKTLDAYWYRLGVFILFHPELPTTPEPLETFIARAGPEPETRDTYFRLLRGFYRWLVKRKLLPTNDNPFPMIEAPVMPHKVARGLTPDELHQLLAFPGHARPMRAFLHLLADTGIRLSEGLSVADYPQTNPATLTVKGKEGEREVPVSPPVRAMVLEPLPWPWPTHRHQDASRAVRKAFRAAGFTGKRASAQTLRHTFTRLWEGDESVLVGIQGWTSFRMLRVYKPYNVGQAVEQHRVYSPWWQAAKSPVRQLELFTDGAEARGQDHQATV